MTTWATSAACSLVRLWTRLYTAGLPALTRGNRLDEIESDLWDSMHDATHGRLGARQVLARLLLGIHDDLQWRAAHMSRRGLAAIACSLIGVATLFTWFYVNIFGPQSLPQPHGRSLQFVSDRPAPPPPPPPPQDPRAR
jgi:hypothetical protein